MVDPADPTVQARRAAVDRAVVAVREAMARELEQDGMVSYVEMLAVLVQVMQEPANHAALSEWQEGRWRDDD